MEKNVSRLVEISKDTICEILIQHGLWLHSGGASGRRGSLQCCDLTGFNFTELNLRHFCFRGACLVSANFTNTNLMEADLSNADLRNIKFKSANFQAANLKGALSSKEFRCSKELQNAILADENVLLNSYEQKNFEKKSYISLNEFSKEIHQLAKEKGWWNGEANFAEVISLCHSELSEALEEYRNRKPFLYFENNKPEGIAIEMVDCLIRILDWCASEGIDVDKLVKIKHEYNKTREYRHGDKRI